jgi:hypothetical protein
MSYHFTPLLRLKFTSIKEHYGLGYVIFCHAAREVFKPQLHRHQGCGMLTQGTCSLFATKRVTATIVAAHPTSTVRTKVQAFKHIVVIIVLTNAESELCSDELAIQSKVQVGYYFKAYHLAK